MERKASRRGTEVIRWRRNCASAQIGKAAFLSLHRATYLPIRATTLSLSAQHHIVADDVIETIVAALKVPYIEVSMYHY